jgi:LAS superfamily LD-carboxypeptidase LdcB
VNAAELTGRSVTHLDAVPELSCRVHRHAITALRGLRDLAKKAGIDLVAVSAFRDFERQLSIWNGKYRGERPLVAPNGQRLDVQGMTAPQRVAAILHWSALPGASRHHWGTDVDLVDRNAITDGYVVQLTPEEFVPGGPFAALGAWLDQHAAHFGFFRPYRGLRSGVQPEPWHFSFAPLAEPARRQLTPGMLADTLAAAPLYGKDEVLAQIDELHAQYVARIDWP